jgi:hypothetical protein
VYDLVCPTCLKQIRGIGVTSTLGTFCSYTCSVAAVPQSKWATETVQGTYPRKKVACRVLDPEELKNAVVHICVPATKK